MPPQYVTRVTAEPTCLVSKLERLYKSYDTRHRVSTKVEQHRELQTETDTSNKRISVHERPMLVRLLTIL